MVGRSAQALGALSLLAPPASPASPSPPASRDWHLVAWAGPEQPDYVRAVAVVGAVQQHAASGQAQVAVAGLRWALHLLFGQAAATTGTSHGSGPGGVDAAGACSGAASAAAGASRWLQLKAVSALDEWAKGGGGIEPGGLLAGQDLLFSDQRLPGLTGGPCPACQNVVARMVLGLDALGAHGSANPINWI